jgi:hypothetical protein
VNGFTVRCFSTDCKLVHGRQKLLQTFPNDGVIVSNDRLHRPTTCIASADTGIMVSINGNQGL